MQDELLEQEDMKSLSNLIDSLAITSGKEFQQIRVDIHEAKKEVERKIDEKIDSLATNFIGQMKYNTDLINLRIDILHSKIDNGFDKLAKQIAKIGVQTSSE